MKVTAQLRLKNALVLEFRSARGWNQKEMGEFCGVTQQDICSIETMNFHRVKETRIEAVATAIGSTLDEIAPPALREEGKRVKTNFDKVVDIHVDTLIAGEYIGLRALPSPDRAVEVEEEKAYVHAALKHVKTVNKRVWLILRARHGIGLKVRSLKDLGKKLGISTDRVRQLEAKGMRMLQWYAQHHRY